MSTVFQTRTCGCSVVGAGTDGNPYRPSMCIMHQGARDERYEGWSNRETFAVAQWIDNDERKLNKITARVRQALAETPGELRWFPGELRELVDLWSNAEQDDPGMSTLDVELVICALSRVNWRELAEHYIAKAKGGVS